MLNKKHISPILWGAFILFFSVKMLGIIWPYTSWDWEVDFLLTKQMIIHLDHYRLSFYAHIFSSLLVLFSGAFLFSSFVLKKWPLLHRWFGKIYVGLLLLVSAPSGMVMAFYANGGWLAKISFLILTPLWWYFTWKGYQTARQRKFKLHQDWMMRSYALTLSAVSLRIYQVSLSYYFYIDPELQYILISWASWLGNWLLVEVLIYQRRLKKTKKPFLVFWIKSKKMPHIRRSGT